MIETLFRFPPSFLLSDDSHDVTRSPLRYCIGRALGGIGRDVKKDRGAGFLFSLTQFVVVG